MKNPNQNILTTKITGLSHDGRGIAHINGKTTFIDGALPEEEVSFIYTRHRGKFDEGKVVEILIPSADRVIPKCKHFGICNGCSLQHLAHEKQLELKQKTMLEQLEHFGDTKPEIVFEPLTGPLWNYRSKARLSVKYVAKKQKVLLGFHEKNGRYVAEIEKCPILHESIGNKINVLSDLISKMSVFQAIPQIEIAVVETATALIIRHLKEFSPEDIIYLKNFGVENNFQFFLQPSGRESIHCITSDTELLTYKVQDFSASNFKPRDFELLFNPLDFTQINQALNQKMILKVFELLNLQPNDKVLDLFCGIGNFTIPLAKHCEKITGIEGDKEMVKRAQENVIHNGITNTNFYAADLSRDSAVLRNENWAQQKYDKILLDPPRTGAPEIVKLLPNLNPQLIVYVSCNPATLARDTKELTAQKYYLKTAGIIDMFPHTSHVETIAVFCK